jgi:N-acyl amino acid synthase of PEP-CTERM/exosortase system
VALFDGVALPPPDESAEVSRLMVHANYRRRQGEHAPDGVADGACTLARTHEMRNPSPQILLTLYRLMYDHSLRCGIRYWYAAMEQSLARLLIRMGFGFQQVGPATDYYGPVAPYVGDLRLLEAQLEQHNPALMAWMRGLANS